MVCGSFQYFFKSIKILRLIQHYLYKAKTSKTFLQAKIITQIKIVDAFLHTYDKTIQNKFGLKFEEKLHPAEFYGTSILRITRNFWMSSELLRSVLPLLLMARSFIFSSINLNH